jgi:hypothetical protein
MAKKFPLTIRQEKLVNYNVFDLSFDRRWLGVVIFGAFDLRAFNKAGYLAKLVDNFKEKDKACYILFSSFGGVRGATEVSIDKVLFFTSHYLTLEPIIPEKWSEKLFFSCPNPIHFLILETGIENIQKVFEYIDSMDTWCYFIFEDEANKDALFAKVKELHKKKTLDEQGVSTLGAEMIKYRVGKYGAEDSLKIFTYRFNVNQIKNIILSSIDRDKFEVIVK